METTFNKQQTKKLIEEYYERLEGRKVKVSISAKIDSVGWYEETCCKSTISVSETFEIAGVKKVIKSYLTREKVNENLKALFALYEFDVKGIDFNSGISSHSEGYGMAEHTVNRAYFHGITVNLEKNKGVKLNKTF